MPGSELKETLTKQAKRPISDSEIGKEGANEDDNEDERQIEDLEKEVKELAQKIVDFRSSIPKRIGEIVSSASLALSRPNLSLVLTSDSSEPIGEEPQPELNKCSSLTEADEKELERLNYLRKKAMGTIAGAPLILKRMNECLERFNRIKQNNVNIPSSFKRRKKW